MRTDVRVSITKKLRVPEIPIASPGRPSVVGRGDFIVFKVCEWNYYGRIIGVVNNPDDGKDYFCTLMMSRGGDLWERWVLPRDVVDTQQNGDDYMCLFADKAWWFHSPDFLGCPPDIQRQASEKLFEDIVSKETVERQIEYLQEVLDHLIAKETSDV